MMSVWFYPLLWVCIFGVFRHQIVSSHFSLFLQTFQGLVEQEWNVPSDGYVVLTFATRSDASKVIVKLYITVEAAYSFFPFFYVIKRLAVLPFEVLIVSKSNSLILSLSLSLSLFLSFSLPLSLSLFLSFSLPPPSLLSQMHISLLSKTQKLLKF